VKTINERYHIVKKLSETNSSFNFLVEDTIEKRQCVLKMLNRNIPQPHALDYFIKEYCHNAKLTHPLIRNPYVFETCVNIDGNVLSEQEYFFCVPYYDSPTFLTKTTSSPVVKYLIGDVLSFLHDNGIHHGDICPENIWVIDDNICFVNLRPFGSYESGQKDDLMKLSTMLKQFTAKDLVEQMAERYASMPSKGNTAIHLKILAEAIRHFSPPLYTLFPATCSDVKKIISSEQEILFSDSTDVRNAQLWMRSLLPDIEVLGFRRIVIDDTDVYTPFSIMKQIIYTAGFYKKTAAILQEYENEFCKIAPSVAGTPRQILSTPLDEEAKLQRLSLLLITEYAALHPIALVVTDWTTLDSQSLKLLQTIKSSVDATMIKVVAAVSGLSNATGQIYIECPVLDMHDFSRLVRYFFYYYTLDQQDINHIFEITGGDITLFADGVQKAVRENGFTVSAGSIHMRHPYEYYFDIGGTFSTLYPSLGSDIRQIFAIVRLFDGKFPIKIAEKLPKEFQQTIDEAIAAQFLVKSNEAIQFRYLVFKDYINDTVSVESMKLIASILQPFLLNEPILLHPYMALLVALKKYDDFAAALLEVINGRKQLAFAADSANMIWPCLTEMVKNVNELTRGHRFAVFEQLLFHNYRFGTFTSDELLSKMKDCIQTEDEHLRYKTVLLKFGEPDDHDIDESETMLQTIKPPVSKIVLDFVSAYINRMTNSGFYEKAIKAYDAYMAPSIETFDVRDKVEAYIRNVVLCFRIQNRVKTWNYLEKLREIIEMYPDRVDDNCRFVYYNSVFAMLQQEGKYQKALSFADKAIAIAESVRDYRKLALVYNNMGVLLSTINQRKSGFEMFMRSLENAFKGTTHDWILLGTGNIMEYFLTFWDFAAAKNAYLRALPSLDHSHNINQRSHILVIGAMLMYDLGDYDAGDDMLARCRVILSQKGSVLYDESLYQALEFRYTYRVKGREAALRHLNDLKSTDNPALNDRIRILIYINILNDLFYLDEKELLVELLTIIDGNNEILPQDIDYNNVKSLLILLRIWAGLDRFTPSCISLGRVEETGLHVLYHYLAYMHLKETDLDRNEHLFHCCTLLHEAYAKLPVKMKSCFYTHSKFVKKYEPFLTSFGFSLKNASFTSMRRKFSGEIDALFSRRRQRILAKTQLHQQMADTEKMMTNFLTEARGISGFERVLYLDYDHSGHWIKREEQFNPIWYKEDEPYAEHILTEMMKKGTQGIYYSLLSSNDAPLTAAVVVPLFDTALSRKYFTGKQKRNGHETALGRMFLRGALYLDTKYEVLRPTREHAQYLIFIKEKMTMFLYYSSLKQAMLLDALTGLYKRETWFDMVKNVLATSRDQGKKHTVVMTDIDYFKTVNDTFGHKTGDSVLRSVAHITMSTLRMMDLGGRFGGEEFVYCLIDTSDEAAKKAVERIRQTVASTRLLKDQSVSLSAGYAVFPDDGDLLSDLIEKADQALLYAKRNGRNRCVSWQECMSAGETPIRQKMPVIDNYSREKEKIDLIIDLIDTVEISGGLRTALAEIRNICVRYLDIDDVLFCMEDTNAYRVEPEFYSKKIKRSMLTSEVLFEGCALYASFRLEGRFYGVYFVIKNDSQRPLLEKRFYSFVAKIIAEKLISASIVTSEK